MIRRTLHGTFWLKVVAIGMVLVGFSEKSAALSTGGITLFICAKQLWDGIHEQFWESPEDQAARHWEDLVWGHSQWVNAESPDEGIVRLTRPFRQEQSWPSADTGSPTATERFSSLRDRWTSRRRSFTSVGATGQLTPSGSTSREGPHFLEVR